MKILRKVSIIFIFT